MMSPLYFAERLRLPDVKVVVRTACAAAGTREFPLIDAALPDTVTGLPSGEPLFRSCIVPVGAIPLLVVVSVAVTVIWVPAVADDGTPLVVVEVCAWVIVIGSVAEVLPA